MTSLPNYVPNSASSGSTGGSLKTFVPEERGALSPVQRSLDALTLALDRLEKVVGLVPGRLACVLGPETAVDPDLDVEDAVAARSAVVGALERCEARVSACARDLAALLDRVEV